MSLIFEQKVFKDYTKCTAVMSTFPPAAVVAKAGGVSPPSLFVFLFAKRACWLFWCRVAAKHIKVRARVCLFARRWSKNDTHRQNYQPLLHSLRRYLQCFTCAGAPFSAQQFAAK
jgi:hypothetical protein